MKQTLDSSRSAASLSPWSPLKHGLFRGLWLASIASNIGTWMHEVGAGWLMTSLSASPMTVALVQVAAAAPMFSSRCRRGRWPISSTSAVTCCWCRAGWPASPCCWRS